MLKEATILSNTWVGSGEGRCNEDALVADARTGCAVLVDGATGLTKANLVAGTSDAAWYAQGLCAETLRGAGAGMSTQDALAKAGEAMARAYMALEGADELGRIDLPNGSVAVLRWDGDELEVCMLGDCYAVVGTGDGEVVVHDATLDALDQRNYELMYAYACEHGVPMRQARRDLNHKFVENRLTMNQPGGYWAADVTCAGFGHETLRCFPLADVRYAFACSDGYAAAVEMGVCASIEELAHLAAEGQGEDVGTRLRVAEREDAECLRVHRSKTSDDATYVAVMFRG